MLRSTCRIQVKKQYLSRKKRESGTDGGKLLVLSKHFFPNNAYITVQNAHLEKFLCITVAHVRSGGSHRSPPVSISTSHHQVLISCLFIPSNFPGQFEALTLSITKGTEQFPAFVLFLRLCWSLRNRICCLSSLPELLAHALSQDLAIC